MMPDQSEVPTHFELSLDHGLDDSISSLGSMTSLDAEEEELRKKMAASVEHRQRRRASLQHTPAAAPAPAPATPLPRKKSLRRPNSMDYTHENRGKNIRSHPVGPTAGRDPPKLEVRENATTSLRTLLNSSMTRDLRRSRRESMGSNSNRNDSLDKRSGHTSRFISRRRHLPDRCVTPDRSVGTHLSVESTAETTTNTKGCLDTGSGYIRKIRLPRQVERFANSSFANFTNSSCDSIMMDDTDGSFRWACNQSMNTEKSMAEDSLRRPPQRQSSREQPFVRKLSNDSSKDTAPTTLCSQDSERSIDPLTL